MRLFTAIALPDDVRAHVAQLQEGLRAEYGARLSWTSPANFHITLKFLGEVEDDRLDAVRRSLRQIEVEPMRLFVDHIQPFPPRGATRVLSAGLSGDQLRVASLFGDIQEVCIAHRVQPDRRQFTPHITIGRSRGGIRFADHPIDRGPLFEATSFELIKSELTPRGSIHEVVETYR